MPKISGLLLVVLCLWGTLVSALLAGHLYRAETEVIDHHFSNNINRQLAALERQLTLNFEALYILKVIFDQEPAPNYETFQRVAASILLRHEGIQALEWIPRVPHADRQRYELAMQHWIPGFQFTRRQEQGVMVPEEQKSEYYPVYYLHPLHLNQAAAGFNLASDPARRNTLTQSMNSGDLRATATITLVQEQAESKGFLAFLPVYRSGESPDKAAFKGFVLGVYRLTDVIEQALDENSQIDIQFFDISELGQRELIYHNHIQHKSLSTSVRHKLVFSDVAGRTWEVMARPSKKYVENQRTLIPFLVFGAGVVFTLLLMVYYLAFVRKP